MKKITLLIIAVLAFINLYGQRRMFSSQNGSKITTTSIIGSAIALNQIVYSQSSVYSSNTAATNNKMTDGIFAESSQTGTNNTSVEWIKMDLGSVTNVKSVVIGCDFSNILQGGWGKSYTENKIIQYSTDNINWTTAFNTGTFNQGIKTFTVNFSARYIRIFHTGWVCLTEFYATGA
jgi:hypothetical protein